MTPTFAPVKGRAPVVMANVSGEIAELLVRVTLRPSTELPLLLAEVGTHTDGGFVQLLFASVGTHTDGGVVLLLFASVGTHSDGGFVQLLFASVGTHSDGGFVQLLFASVGTHSDGGWLGVEQPVCAGLLRPMPWLVSHS